MTPTAKMTKLSTARNAERDRRLRSDGAAWDRWGSAFADRLTGMLARRKLNARPVLDRMVIDAARRLERDLSGLWWWAWESTAGNLVDAVPMPAWIARLSPIDLTEGVADGQLLGINQLKKILDATVSRDEAKEIVRKTEFPPPPDWKVRQILTATNAPDGISPMQRIVTVAQDDKDSLLSIMTGGIPTGSDGASLIDSLTPQIESLVGNITYKAKRIARTEGVRIAEVAQRESWQDIADLMDGVRTYTADDANVRDQHVHWNGKLFYRQSNGDYVARDGELLPDFPAGPNCRCWSTPEFREDLTAGLPPVDYGSGYAASVGRL